MANKGIPVCGTLNLETTFSITGFPLDYEPVSYRPFALRSQPPGVGFNIARALSTLRNRVRLVSMVGNDFLGTALRQLMTGSACRMSSSSPCWTKRRAVNFHF
jgi:sugar/nucleoside kinase (ribokinase family)